MRVKITTVEELKQIFMEAFMNKTNKVTKVSDHSAMNGIAYGVAKVAQKAMKDVALVESHQYPDVAYDEQLDEVADHFGIAPRFTATKSSVYVKVFATAGTVYTAGLNDFIGTDGISFELESNVTIGANGFEYVKVRSKETGERTNVEALTISKMTQIPNGHQSMINEFRAMGGRDTESDDLFRKRIKEGSNILAKGSISAIEQAFMRVNNNVLRVYNAGTNNNGKVVLKVASQNGADFTDLEFGVLLNSCGEFFNIVDLKPYQNGQVMNVILQNVEYDYLDFSFRIGFQAGYDTDTIRKEIQTRILNVLDFRYWDVLNGRIEWDNMLEITKKVRGVKYVPDNYFLINGNNKDYLTGRTKLPRVRGFILYNLDGTVLSDNSGVISSVYYPNQPDTRFQASVL